MDERQEIMYEMCKDAEHVIFRCARNLFTDDQITQTSNIAVLFDHADLRGKFCTKYDIAYDENKNKPDMAHEVCVNGHHISVYIYDTPQKARMDRYKDDISYLVASYVDGAFEYQMYDIYNRIYRRLTQEERENFINKRTKVASVENYHYQISDSGWEHILL